MPNLAKAQSDIARGGKTSPESVRHLTGPYPSPMYELAIA